MTIFEGNVVGPRSYAIWVWLAPFIYQCAERPTLVFHNRLLVS